MSENIYIQPIKKYFKIRIFITVETKYKTGKVDIVAH
jgi:hypothetical protein